MLIRIHIITAKSPNYQMLIRGHILITGRP